jgi:hypothetical protein
VKRGGGAFGAVSPSTMLRMVPLPMELRSTGRTRVSRTGLNADSAWGVQNAYSKVRSSLAGSFNRP